MRQRTFACGTFELERKRAVHRVGVCAMIAPLCPKGAGGLSNANRLFAACALRNLYITRPQLIRLHGARCAA